MRYEDVGANLCWYSQIDLTLVVPSLQLPTLPSVRPFSYSIHSYRRELLMPCKIQRVQLLRYTLNIYLLVMNYRDLFVSNEVTATTLGLFS